MHTKKILVWVLFIIAPLSLGILFSIYINQSQNSLEGVRATVLSEGKFLPEFTLEDHHGKSFTNENLKGQWSFIFFGYTHCPDICPTTLSLLNQVDQVLKKETDIALPKTVFISVDPERDTVKHLAEYVSYFNPEFIGVTGRIENIQMLSSALGIAFGQESIQEDGSYEIYHGARVMLIDPDARLRALFSLSPDVNTIASDYLKIIAPS